MIYSLGILAVLALGLIIIPVEANADLGGYVTPYNSTNYNNNPVQNNSYMAPNTSPTPINNSAAPIVYSNNPNGSQTSNTTVSRTVVERDINSSNTSDSSTENSNTTTEKSKESSSSLAANAVFGSNSFTPSGLIQWIFFAILVLLVVIIVRRFYGADKRYYSTPLKHA